MAGEKEFAQLRLHFTDPVQHDYEVIRPVILFAQPVAVLGWKRGRELEPGELQRTFKHLQFPRTVNRHGCVSVQRFYIYAEQGLAKHRVAVWIYDGRLNVEYQQHLLARYRCVLDRHQNTLTSVSQPKLYSTSYMSPQVELFALDDKQWNKVRRRPPYTRRKTMFVLAKQIPLGLDFGLLLRLF